jgi:hypothetical protein
MMSAMIAKARAHRFMSITSRLYSSHGLISFSLELYHYDFTITIQNKNKSRNCLYFLNYCIGMLI